MRFLKMPPQILRLVLLIFAIVVSYLVARTLLTPSSFREFGFYRGAALVELAARTPVYAGKQACGVRHPDVLKTLAKGGHKTLSCEGCHGVVSKDQLENPDRKMEKPTAKICLRCHEASPSRPVWFRQITVKDHYAETCIECHIPHEPNEVNE
ncbi:MAG: hypothetical protein NTW21_17035 [Verrucomicrobia bacterium]|nr:hypothetical protein [Verrucomicrobiota bacterium]